jgi:hypothetical protein
MSCGISSIPEPPELAVVPDARFMLARCLMEIEEGADGHVLLQMLVVFATHQF